MCIGIALAWSELPKELVGRHGLHRRVHERGGEPEVRFYFNDRVPRLPIWRDGRLQIARWGNGAITFWIEGHGRRSAADGHGATTIAAFAVLARIVLWVVILLTALGSLGVNITALVTGLGVGGIAVALAVQNILGDLFAAFSIVVDKPFVVGETIHVDTFIGTVENIGLKSTRLRSLSGEQVIISNADLLKSRIRNYKRMRERRASFVLGLTYDTPAETMARVPVMLREIVEAQPDTRFDRSHFLTWSDSALQVETVYYILSPDYTVYANIQQAINLEVLRRFAAERIQFAFPTRTTIVRQETTGDLSATARDGTPASPYRES